MKVEVVVVGGLGVMEARDCPSVSVPVAWTHAVVVVVVVVVVLQVLLVPVLARS